MSTSRVANNVIVELWTILDFNSDPLTGMTTPADITFTLHRESGGTMIAAGESITFAEVGSTGHYYIAFTPLNTGVYVLQLKELNASSLQRTWRFDDYLVVAAGASFSASYANAYCAETDIERWLQQAISGTTNPSDTEAAGFAESRASILTSLVNGWGYAVTPSTVTAGSVLEDLLREANAIGAALDYTIAQVFGRSPSRTDRVEALQALWEQYVGTEKTVGYLQQEVRKNLASLASDHILSGDTQADPTAPTVAPYAEPIGIKMGDIF